MERYKQLLLRQRDLMVALTARLTTREEQINNLREDLDLYDQHQVIDEFAKTSGEATCDEMNC